MFVWRVAAAGLAALSLAAGAASARAAAPPALQAKQARARAVLAQVNELGVRFGKVVDAWDGAKIQLATSKRRLRANARALRRARAQEATANGRLAQRLVALYKEGEPGVVEVLVGAKSLGDLVDRAEAASVIASYDKRLADDALRARRRLATAERQLAATTRRKRAAVATLASSRRTIGSMLAKRRRLLSSVRSEVAVLQQQEAVRQARLAAEARARLAREQALAAARAKEAAAAKAKAAPARTAPAATTEPAATTTAPAASEPATTQAAAPTPAPPASAGAGTPAAATVALRYLGIKYTWGGASPGTGFDCSGLVMYVYAQLGIQLPHQSQAQWGYGTPVSRGQLQPGDLVFYDSLSHVAIYIGNGQVVHAPQTGDVVRIAALDAAGGSYAGARRISR